jgi:hypothetical protein
MTEAESPSPSPLAQEDAKQLRRIAHDINNALELIVQASYLVSTTELSDPAKEWMKLLDQGVRQATDLNRQMREYVMSRS